MQKNILIADDHTIIRNMLVMMVRVTFGCTNVRSVTSCEEILRELELNRYTHGILDITLPDGLILTQMPVIRRLYPGMRIALFSMQPEEIYRQAVRQYGIDYYIPKASGEEETLRMFGKFLNNEPWAKGDISVPVDNPFMRLSQGELQVLHYILKGYRPSEIGNVLNKRKQTIATYRSRIYGKTGTTNDRQLSELATVYHLS